MGDNAQFMSATPSSSRPSGHSHFFHRACVEQILKHNRISFPFTQHVDDTDSMRRGMKFDARPDVKSSDVRGNILRCRDNWFDEFGCQQTGSSTRNAIVGRSSECERWKPTGDRNATSFPTTPQSRLILGCRIKLEQLRVSLIKLGTTGESRDILSSPWFTLVLFVVPAVGIAITAGSEFGSGLRTVVWTAALITMGTACVANAVRCGRLHCCTTGPFFLAMAVVTLLYGLGSYRWAETVGA